MKQFLTFKALLLLCITALLCSSCTVEKRRYMSGYHVEWNKSHGKHQPSAKALEPLPTTLRAVDKNDAATPMASIQNTARTAAGAGGNNFHKAKKEDKKTSLPKNTGDDVQASVADNPHTAMASNAGYKYSDPNQEEPTEPVIHPKAWISFGAGILAWGVLAILLFTGFFPFWWMITAGLNGFAIAYGYISIIEIKDNPGKYKGKGLARTGRALGFAFVVLPIVSLLAIILYFVISGDSLSFGG